MPSLWLCIALAGLGYADPGVQIDPEPPDWVIPQPAPDPAAIEGQRSDIHYLLQDSQVRVVGAVDETYRRQIERIASTAGIQDLTELRFPFDPSTEALTLHHIRVLREGRTLDILDPDELKILQQERELDRQIYNGEVTALAFLRDVRIGDTLDYAWTVRSSNPALAGHYADTYPLGWSVPFNHIHQRLIWPSDRPLHLQPLSGAPEPRTTSGGGTTTYEWDLQPTLAVEDDSGSPSWDDPRPRVWVSDFDTWGRVVDWALPYYTLEDPGPELRAFVDRWTAASDDPEIRTRAALAFAQDEIRYLGIEMGPGGLVPHDPEVVLTRRFGDCKDKAVLLATALQAMGIEAHPALVSTTRTHSLSELNPSPYAFNHAIVQVVLDGEPHWLDATRSLERGPLAAHETPDFAYALVLAPESEGLSPIALSSSERSQVEVLERFEVSDLYEPVQLEIHQTFRGTQASAMRRRFQRATAEQIGQTYLETQLERYPGSTAIGLPVFTDDPSSGEVQVTLRYELPHFWTEERFAIASWDLQYELGSIAEQARVRPLAVDHPVSLEHRVEVSLPEAFRIDANHTTVDDPAFHFESERTYDGDQLTLTARYRSKADHVAAADIEAHRKHVQQARDVLQFTLHPGAIDPGMSPLSRAAAIGFSLLGLLMLGAWTQNSLPRWREALRARSTARAGGETVATSILVPDTRSALAAMDHLRCSCGGVLDPHRRSTQTLRADGVSTLELELPCKACGERTVRYFRFR